MNKRLEYLEALVAAQKEELDMVHKQLTEAQADAKNQASVIRNLNVSSLLLIQESKRLRKALEGLLTAIEDEPIYDASNDFWEAVENAEQAIKEVEP